MADVKISQLPAATTPVVGTEILPIVQSSLTAKVSISNILSAPNPGNVSFSGTGNRITGDFSNATVANRVAFQNSVTNGSTQISLFPNGTSATSLVRVFNNSDPTNCGTGLLYIDGVRVGLDAGITGTGTYLPMTFYAGGSERVRIATTGDVAVGFTGNSGQGIFQVARTISGGAPATSGTTDANQVIAVNASSVQLGYGAYADGTGWIQQRATGNYAVNYNLALNPNGGNVGIGTATPSASAILDAQSTTKGVRMPNMTTTQKNAIASPAAGLMVFDTTLAKLCVYSGAAWQTITSV